jgi:hypothetical protein
MAGRQSVLSVQGALLIFIPIGLLIWGIVAAAIFY